MDADLLSSEDIDVNPSTLDMNINMLGSSIRNIFRAIPGRKPWMNDLIVGLTKKTVEVKGVRDQEHAHRTMYKK